MTRRRAEARICVLGSATNSTNVDLVRSWRSAGLDVVLQSPFEAFRPDAVAIGRLDVLPTLDGVEPGLLALLLLERRGLRVLNRAGTLLAVHDKLRTARRLRLAGLPHPQTAFWRGERAVPLEPPLVVKPRFGSWGRDVVLCRDGCDVARTLEAVRQRPWFCRHGALMQEFVAPNGRDLRLIVAGGELVGCSERIAAPGEWRTNVSLGGSARPADPTPLATTLALAAASAVGADLVGVDLIPLAGDRYVVLELNGAVEFTQDYSLVEGDVFERALLAALHEPAEAEDDVEPDAAAPALV